MKPSLDAGDDGWSPAKDKAVEMAYAGASKAAIARQLGVSRPTVHKWFKQALFREKLEECTDDLLTSVRQRRLIETTRQTSRVAKLLDKAMNKLENAPENLLLLNLAERYSDQFRSWRGEERADMGDIVVRHDHHVNGQINVDMRATHAVAFKEFVGARIDDGAIDVEAVPVGDRGAAVSAMAMALLADPEIMDALDEEDRQDQAVDET